MKDLQEGLLGLIDLLIKDYSSRVPSPEELAALSELINTALKTFEWTR